MADGPLIVPPSGGAAHPDDPGVVIVTGHYGSGKSEFAVNLALAEASSGRRVALADLDIVNPYFRSRERADELEASGVKVISSTLGHVTTLELPAISPEIHGPLADPECLAILDMGGDETGAKVLAQFRADVLRRPHRLLLVVNAYRPETATLQGALDHLDAVEAATRMKVTGLISNTHLLRATTPDDVAAGLELCRELSDASGVAIDYVSAIPDALAPWASEQDPSKTRDGIALLGIGMHLRDEWM